MHLSIINNNRIDPGQNLFSNILSRTSVGPFTTLKRGEAGCLTATTRTIDSESLSKELPKYDCAVCWLMLLDFCASCTFTQVLLVDLVVEWAGFYSASATAGCLHKFRVWV